jgi:rod shape-determining protein MreC
MPDSNWIESSDLSRCLDRHPRGRVRGFVARRGSFFVLLTVLLAQLVLLSVQITRGRNVRLVHVWAAALFMPAEHVIHGAVKSVEAAGRNVGDLWEAQSENGALRAKLATDATRLQLLSAQVREVNHLRSLLKFKSHFNYATLAAQVIAWSPSPGSAAVSINRGTADGVAQDMPVITPEGVVGKVVTTYEHTSQVLLLTDASSGAGAMLEPTGVEGVLQGEGRGLCEMRYVMDEEKVEAGYTVLTSGLDQIYPRGLELGKVFRVGQGNIYKTIWVRPVVDESRLDNVLVLLKKTVDAPTPRTTTP